MLSRFKGKFANENISIDCDAISVVITTEEMSAQKKKALKDFLLVFGTESATSCGIPQSASGHGKKHSIFSCYGKECQHLPEFMEEGEETIVIDSPVKIAIHSTCKEKLVNALKEKDCHMSPAKDSAICFNTSAAANKPPYGTMIDSIIESCKYGLSTYMIHVADFGCKLSIDELKDKDNVVPIFDKMKAMSDLGMTVELAQIDIAFVAHVPKNMLLQMSVVTPTDSNEETDESQDEHHGCDESLIDDAKLSMFPLHELNIQGGKPTKKRDIKGSFLLQKSDQVWKEGAHINLSDRAAIKPFLNNDIQDNRGGATLCQNINTSTIFSVKGYSTIGHLYLQCRKKFIMSTKSMFAAPNRSINSIQNLLTNIENVRNKAFSNEIRQGYGMRLEFSIRPPHDEPLRTRGHYNDILLHVCLGMEDICSSKRYVVKLHLIRLREVETRSMVLLSQARALLRFRHRRKFNEIYCHPKVSAWLRAHLSILFITVGLCPEYNVRYINSWLNDGQRYDPHETIPMQVENVTRDRKSLEKLIITTVKNTCTSVFKSENDAQHLSEYIETFITHHPHGQLKVRYCYKMLSLQCKLHLSEAMMDSIIPIMTELLPDTDDEDNMENMENTEDMENEEFISNARHEMTAMPKDPISQAIYALVQISSIANHRRTGFTSSLCYYILKSHEQTDLSLPNIDENTKSVLLKHIKGEPFTRDTLKSLIAKLMHARARNISKQQFIEKLCQLYMFPYEGLKFSPIPEIDERNDLDKIRNKLINEALEVDYTVILNNDALSMEVYRNEDDATITIKSIDSIVHTNLSAEFIQTTNNRSLYAVIAHKFNTTVPILRLCLHEKIHSKMKEGDIRNAFLTEKGTKNTNFSQASTLDSIQASKKFLFLRRSGKILDTIWFINHPPEIVIPFTAWMYETDIIFYDQMSSTTYIFENNKSRLITYTVGNLSVVPKNPNMTIITRTQDGCYESRVLATFTSPVPIQNNIFHFGPLGGRRVTSRNQVTAVGNTQSTTQSFYSAITQVCHKIDQGYFSHEATEENQIQTSQQKDPLNILPYIKELCSYPTQFKGFSKELEVICGIKNLPLSMILSNLQKKQPDKWTHLMLCPFICIKYKLTMGVMTMINNVKKTYLYGFDRKSEQVQCEICDGYTTLDDTPGVIYLFQNSKRTAIPEKTLKITGNLCRSLHTKYSYLDPHTFKDIIKKLDFGSRSVFYNQIAQEADFRPENMTVQVHTNITCFEQGSGLAQLLQCGVTHHALILIFPCVDDDSVWNACIIHHKFQQQDSAMSVINNLVKNARGPFQCHGISGRESDDCDSGFHMILYAFIAHKLKCFEKFKQAVKIIASENNFARKLRRWVFKIANNKQIQNIPTWIEQIIYRANTETTSDDDIDITTTC